MHRRMLTLLAALALFVAPRTTMSLGDEPPAAPPRLGELSFPTSGSPKAQDLFLVGVKLLHNFEYEEARDTFRACQKIDPKFAMAYWGEAMCFNHPLWGEQDLDGARAVLKRLDSASAGPLTQREQGFLRSLRILYGEGSKDERDRRYLSALADLAERYPDDHESACFHALAMLGTCGGNRDTRVYMRAAGLLEGVFAENAHHPGVLHYLIHCYDDPIHAPLGLRAARLYGRIAENSAHAKHMPSHIYLPLGMWRETIEANEEAWEAGVKRLKRRRSDAADYDIHALHALQWLQYGYLQRGDYRQARRRLETMADIHRRKPTPMTKWYFGLMRASYVVEAPDWRKADMEINMSGVELSATASDLFARGLAAVRSGATGAERAMKRIVALRSAAEKSIEDINSHHHSSYFDGVHASSIRHARIMETQLEAIILLADGDTDRSIARLRDAVAAEERVPTGYGPPVPVKPSQELLGEVLLNLDRPAEAEQHFRRALQRAPRRAASLIGLAEAAERQNQTALAQRTRAELKKILGENKPYMSWRELPPAK